MNTLDHPLHADLERLSSRVYPEEGIPMYLVCEDLAFSKSIAITLGPLNESLPSAFHSKAKSLELIRPDAPVTDVCKVVELLAERGFGSPEPAHDL